MACRVIQDSFAKWAERQRDYQAAGACERAVGDMLAWLAAAYPSVECKRSGMYLVVVDKESKKVRDDGVALFKYPKDSMTPASARLHVAEMYTLDSSQGVWQFDREATRENLNRKVKGYAHTVAAIGQSIFLDWGWNQFLMPERFELRLAADVKETDRHPSAAQHAPAFAVADNPTL